MRTTSVSVFAILLGTSLSGQAGAQTVPATSADYSNALAGAVSASSENTINLQVAGTVAIKGFAVADSVGISVIDGKQLLNDNIATFLPGAGGETPDFNNTASLGPGALQNATGNIAVAISSGTNNAQNNSVAIGKFRRAQQIMKTDVVQLQEAINNQFAATGTVPLVNNTASVGDGTLNGASGAVGINVSAGANNAQANALTATVGSVAALSVLASANVGVLQRAENNSSTHQEAYNKSEVGVVGVDLAGHVGMNVASGAHNLQNNSLAVVAIVPGI